MKIRHAFLIALLAGTTGCFTHTQSYKVAVVNRMNEPVTLWLVKDNGPAESGWLSPEQVAEAMPTTDDQLPDVIVQPNQTARIGPIEGQFYNERPRASLRVYGGTPTLTQMLSRGRGGLNRLDLELQPGANDIVLQEQVTGAIGATRNGAAPPATEPAR